MITEARYQNSNPTCLIPLTAQTEDRFEQEGRRVNWLRKNNPQRYRKTRRRNRVKVFKVHDAQDALTIIESGIRVYLLFTDVVMPVALRSTDLARQAKSRLSNLAVLFTSGYTQHAIVHGGRLDPSVELLPKPYDLQALVTALSQC